MNKEQCIICGALLILGETGPCRICLHLKQSGIPLRCIKAKKSDFSDSLSDCFDKEENLFIHGIVGSGKTWLLSAIMRDAIKKTGKEYVCEGAIHTKGIYEKYKTMYYESQGIFISLPELMLRLRNSMNRDSSESESEIIDEYTQVTGDSYDRKPIPDLYIDDIGSEKTTDYVRSSLFLLIDRRYNQMKARTLITSNLSLNEIAEQQGQRIASRITGMCRVVKLTGSDRRLEQ